MKGIPSLANGIPTARSATEVLNSVSVFVLVDQLVLLQPRHHRPQPAPDLFDGMGLHLLLATHCRPDGSPDSPAPTLLRTGLLNFAQDLLHFLFCLFGHYPRTASDITILGRRADGIPHIGNAALIDQVHDQFYFMQALEIGHFRGIAGFHERFVPGLDERREPATEHDLLAEEIRFRFFSKIRFNDAGPPSADRAGIGQGRLAWSLRLDPDGSRAGTAPHCLSYIPIEPDGPGLSARP